MTHAANHPRFKIDASWDLIAKRYVGECPLCGYRVYRAKRDAALHVLSQHVSYQHEGQTQ